MTKLPARLLIIHGFNNNEALFEPLKEYFKFMGLEVIFITLPCHGENRTEAKEYESAFKCFKANMKKYTNHPNYSILAFSQGGLFTQLWLNKHRGKMPRKQILLAPALYINNSELIMNLAEILPSFIPIQSLGRRDFLRYPRVSVWEYRILLHGIKDYDKLKPKLKIPTLIITDPDDELVNPYKIKEELASKENEEYLTFKFWPRKYLGIKHGLGKHHLIVHPDYLLVMIGQGFLRN